MYAIELVEVSDQVHGKGIVKQRLQFQHLIREVGR